MKLDHIAYRVKDKGSTIMLFCEAFGYKPQNQFEITLEDGSVAKCMSLEPTEEGNPEIFVSSGPPGSLIDDWVDKYGHGVGGIHHMAYQVDDVEKTQKQWLEKGYHFTTDKPLECEDLTQIFTKPNPYTGIVYEFIKRKGQKGFCEKNVGALMSSTKETT